MKPIKKEIKIIKKREIIRTAAKLLGKEFTIPQVETTYKAIEETIKKILFENNNVQIRLMEGLVISSTIRPEHDHYIMPDGRKITSPPRKWVRAKITNHFNRKVINNLEH